MKEFARPVQETRSTRPVAWRYTSQNFVRLVGIVVQWCDPDERGHVATVESLMAAGLDLLDGHGHRFEFVERLLRASPIEMSPGIDLVLTLDPVRFAESVAFVFELVEAPKPLPVVFRSSVFSSPFSTPSCCPSCGCPLRIVGGS